MRIWVVSGSAGSKKPPPTMLIANTDLCDAPTLGVRPSYCKKFADVTTLPLPKIHVFQALPAHLAECPRRKVPCEDCHSDILFQDLEESTHLWQ